MIRSMFYHHYFNSIRSLPFIVPIVFLFALTACQSNSDPDKGSEQEKKASGFHISGKIEEPLDSNFRLIFEPFDEYRTFRTELDSSGSFSLKVPFDRPSFFQLRQGKLITQIYAEPGDSIRLTANGKKPFKTLSFSGSGKERNEYLLEWKRFSIDSFRTAKKALYQKDLIQDPSRFDKALDSVFRMREDFLADHEDSLDERFMQLEDARMAFDRAVQRFRFHRYLKYKGADSSKVGKDFWAPIEELDLTDPRNVAFPAYYSFLKLYGFRLRQKAIEADSALTDSARFPVLYKAFKEKVESDTARYAFLAKNLYYQLRLRGAERTGPSLQKLEEAPFFNNLQDSLKAIYDKWQRIAAGKEAPGFSYPNVAGDTLTLADLKGKLVYIDAWATWCGPCKREIPHLKELEERFSEDPIAFVSISLDREKDRKTWEKMVDDKELGGHQLFANGEAFGSEFARAYQIRSIPRFILIGPDGKIIDANAERPSNDAAEQLEKAMEENPELKS